MLLPEAIKSDPKLFKSAHDAFEEVAKLTLAHKPDILKKILEEFNDGYEVNGGYLTNMQLFVKEVKVDGQGKSPYGFQQVAAKAALACVNSKVNSCVKM